ncbi:DNA-binding protein [Legionella quinlivanii]|uniref:DNA-binding protein n=1 Tax=Legionella quinlivanii TaxID=45073 RepID=A0A364LHK6_9GAMM|nr:TIR domain-containing protein [Legionella quinlivanii]RAP35726.1 DNA-binding protein [Legionella quinlivanii]
MKYKDDFESLKKTVELAGCDGEWKDSSNGVKQFKANNGAVLNWWSTKGTLTFQGTSPGKEDLEKKMHSILLQDNSLLNKQEKHVCNKVFVVYGHDEHARDQLDAMLRRWGLEPLILDQLPSKGQTIIEKLEEYTEGIGFGVVLATPDDEGHQKGRVDEKTFRTRQNVVLELGILLTKLGRHKVAILLKDPETMERPSDIQGLIYIAFKDNLQKEAGPMLAKEMVSQGFEIDVMKL